MRAVFVISRTEFTKYMFPSLAIDIITAIFVADVDKDAAAAHGRDCADALYHCRGFTQKLYVLAAAAYWLSYWTICVVARSQPIF